MTVALITGGSRGLGRSAALELAKQKTNIIITYHSNKEAAEEVVAEIKFLGLKAIILAYLLFLFICQCTVRSPHIQRAGRASVFLSDNKY